MLKIRFIALSVACMLCGCGHNHEGEELGHHHHHAEGEAGHLGEETVLEPEVAERFGVKTDTVKEGEFPAVLKVSGKLLPNNDNMGVASAKTSGIITLSHGISVGSKVVKGSVIGHVNSTGVTGGDVNAAAKANLDAAKKELDRVTPLHADGIVSTKQYNEALQAYNQARAAYSPQAATGAVIAPISGTITSVKVASGGYVDAGQPVVEISTSDKLVLRADIPDRYLNFRGEVVDARIKLPWMNEAVLISELNGKKLSGGVGAQTQPGYVPVFFSFDNVTSDNGAYAGAAVEVYLIGSAKSNVISVPITAISEQQGDYFVYEKLDEECYMKRSVKLGLNDGQNVEILSGLNGGENIVVEGATTLRLAESSAIVPEGHSHNH